MSGLPAKAPPVQGFDPESCRSLYIGNLAPQVTEPLLYEIFGALGSVENVKIIKDKLNSSSLGYGFVDYYDHHSAQMALNQLNGREIYGLELKVNWAFAGGQREDTSTHHHIFVGDLSPDIDDQSLFEAFSAFGSLSDARVMWDQNTGRSRGYGFVAFRDEEDAEQAIREMNGVWLGTRAIRVNWANNKLAPKPTAKPSPLKLDDILMQASPLNTTVYVGNLAPETTDPELAKLFGKYGIMEEMKVSAEKGYAFIKYQVHDSAARAIVGCHGVDVAGRPIRCSWGKERPLPPQGTPQVTPQITTTPFGINPYPFPNYGTPNYNIGIGGFPQIQMYNSPQSYGQNPYNQFGNYGPPQNY